MIAECHFCDKEYEQKDCTGFCSNICNNEYWKNPIKVLVKSTCPTCHKDFTRECFSIEVRGWSALECCPSCSEKPIIIENSIRYKKTQEQ